MNTISLTQVSAFVVAVSLASFFVNVNADAALIHSNDHSTVVQSETSPVENVVEAEEESNNKFTFTSLDTDKNGKLSQEEVLAGKNEWLVKTFNRIDSNADKSLTEQELVDFVSRNTTATI